MIPGRDRLETSKWQAPQCTLARQSPKRKYAPPFHSTNPMRRYRLQAISHAPHLPPEREEDVCRLEVSVHDPLLVHVADGRTDLAIRRK